MPYGRALLAKPEVKEALEVALLECPAFPWDMDVDLHAIAVEHFIKDAVARV